MTVTMMRSCSHTNWRTPPEIIEPVREALGGSIALDPATSFDNPTKAVKIYTPEDDGLSRTWEDGFWVNPPFGKVLPDWVRKINDEAMDHEGIVLLPGQRFETRYMQDTLMAHPLLEWICFVRARIKFIRASPIVPYNPEKGDQGPGFIYRDKVHDFRELAPKVQDGVRFRHAAWLGEKDGKGRNVLTILPGETKVGAFHLVRGKSNTYGSMLWGFGDLDTAPLRHLGVIWRKPEILRRIDK